MERSTFDSSYAIEILRGIEQTIVGTPYNLVLISEAENAAKTQSRFQSLIQQHKVDGLILTGLHQDIAEQVSRIQVENSFPLVYIGKRQTVASCNVYANYHALTPVLSQDPNQRTTIVSWKNAMGGVASILVGSLALPLVNAFGGGARG